MRSSRIKTKWASGQPALVTTCHLTDPCVAELTSLMGFDGIWLDLEHHVYSLETAGQMMRAARVGVADIVARPAKGEFARMSRMLEAGAQGIMYPRCQDAAEAKEVVDWIKFAPQGKRGFDGANPDAPYCSLPLDEYIQRANQETVVIIQIEDPVALERAEEIAAVDGVDVIMLGPGDFSILSGVPGEFDHPLVQQALAKIAAAASNTGKRWATTTRSLEHARSLLDAGAGLLFHNADILLIKEGQERVQQQFAALGFTFDRQI